MNNSKKAVLSINNISASNVHSFDLGLPFNMLVANIQKRFNDEIEAKNTAYRFIMLHGLSDEFLKYRDKGDPDENML